MMTLPSRPFTHAQPNGRRAVVALLVALASCADPTTPVAVPELSPAVEAKGAPPADIPVTTNISADASLLTRADGLGAYSGGYINSGSYQLYLGNQSVRKIWLTLAGQGIPGIPDGLYSADVGVDIHCFTDASGTMAADLTTMTNGMSNSNCGFGVNFSYAGTKYRLAMSPKYAGTSHATATCTAPATGACTAWAVTSDPAANGCRQKSLPV